MRVGIVDLDTSHPEAFKKIIDDSGDSFIHAVYDSGDVRPPGYAEEFAQVNNIPVVCSSLEEMSRAVDGVMILSANWDRHLERAVPFIKSGIPVLIDKPVVGNIADADKLIELQKQYKARIFGGSSLRFAKEINVLNSKLIDSGKLSMVIAYGPGDVFNYGIHIVEMAQGITGLGAESVEYIGGRKFKVFVVQYSNGLVLRLHLSGKEDEWTCIAKTDGEKQSVLINMTDIYRQFIQNFTAFLKDDKKEFNIGYPVEAVKILIGAGKAFTLKRKVSLDSLEPADGYNGELFVEKYRKDKKF